MAKGHLLYKYDPMIEGLGEIGERDMQVELLARGADHNAARFDGARPIQLTNGDYGYRLASCTYVVT